MVFARDYFQRFNDDVRISISHWGMFPIELPTFHTEVEDDIEIRQAVMEDFGFRVPSMVRNMRKFKEEVASYANRLG